MREVRYRTEAFSGTGERDAAEVMAFETFTLGNVDILQTLAEGILKGRGEITNRCWDFIEELNNSGYVEDFGTFDQIEFIKEVLSEIKNVTGVDVRYVLWLADKEVVSDRKWYGRDMDDDEDFDCYEVGPVVLSDLGFDGTLYGYTEMPVRLEDRVVDLEIELVNIINEREEYDNEGIEMDYRRAVWLDERYLEVDGMIQEIESILSKKTLKDPSLDEQIKNASVQVMTEGKSINSMLDRV